MSWPSTDFEVAIQNELDALRGRVAKLEIAARLVLRRFGDEYEGRLLELRELVEDDCATESNRDVTKGKDE